MKAVACYKSMSACMSTEIFEVFPWTALDLKLFWCRNLYGMKQDSVTSAIKLHLLNFINLVPQCPAIVTFEGGMRIKYSFVCLTIDCNGVWNAYLCFSAT